MPTMKALRVGDKVKCWVQIGEAGWVVAGHVARVHPEWPIPVVCAIGGTDIGFTYQNKCATRGFGPDTRIIGDRESRTRR